MNFYLEAMKNDIDIASLDCDIELDRAQLTIDYCIMNENMYNESCNGENYYTESTIGRYLLDGIANALIKVMDLISTCIEKCNELFAKAKLAKLKKDYEKAAKEDPTLKDKMVTFVDRRAIIDERNKLIKEIKKSKKTRAERKKDVEAMTTLTGQYKTKTKLKLSAAIFLLSTLSVSVLSAFALRKDDLLSNKKIIENKIKNRIKHLNDESKNVKTNTVANMLNDEENELIMLLTTLEKAQTKDEFDTVMDLYNQIERAYK